MTFTHLITLTPLGLLYGSAGKFLSPENLVGRSGTHFPPSAATLSGLFAAQLNPTDPDTLHNLQVSGPFWSWQHDPQDFCVPTPLNCLTEFDPPLEPNQIPTATFKERLSWHATSPDSVHWKASDGKPLQTQYATGTWVKLSDWQTLATGTPDEFQQIPAYGEPWQYLPHLHPYLDKDQRIVDTDREKGSLFLENSTQLHPDVCLTYLTNTPLPDGWYRFGGEGHMVELTSAPLETYKALLNETPLGRSFAIVTPAIWGSNRLSTRQPKELKKGDPQRHALKNTDSDLSYQWNIEAMLTQKPIPTRYRLGDSQTPEAKAATHPKRYPKRLSRGRYAVPAGSVYVLERPFADQYNTWNQWPTEWFPQEGPSLKRWGCGLSLPLSSAVASHS